MVTINRATKEIKSEVLQPNFDMSTSVVERTTLCGDDSESTPMKSELFDVSQNGNLKVEVFKNECIQLIKACKFNAWAAAEQE